MTEPNQTPAASVTAPVKLSLSKRAAVIPIVASAVFFAMFARPTSQRDLSTNPYPNSVYWAFVTISLLFGVFFGVIGFAHIASPAPASMILTNATGAMMFLACAQSLERIFAPRRAQARTLNLSPEAHRRLETASSTMCLLWFVVTVASVSLRHAGNVQWRAFGDDADACAYVLLVAAGCMLDLSGLRVFEKGRRQTPQTTV